MSESQNQIEIKKSKCRHCGKKIFRVPDGAAEPSNPLFYEWKWKHSDDEGRTLYIDCPPQKRVAEPEGEGE